MESLFFDFDLVNFQPPDNLNVPDFDDLEPLDPQTTGDKYHEELIHEGKKSHRCTFPNCGKVFKFKSEISRHLVIHFTERPYVCSFSNCHKAFKRPDALENHLRIHTNELPFHCDVPGCTLSFVTKAALRYHLLKHNNERAFTCSFPGCTKTFLTKTQLKQHERAENYHQKIAHISNVPRVENLEPVKKLKAETIAYKDICADIGPAPRMAKSLAWETKNADVVEEPPKVNVGGGDLENMLRQMMEENKLLKEKLEVCTKIMDVFQENREMKMRLPKSPEQKSPFDFKFGTKEWEPNFSMDGSEFNFLNF